MMVRAAIIIRAIRRQMGWSRKDMACAVGSSEAHIGRVERGEEMMKDCERERLEAAVGAKLGRIT